MRKAALAIAVVVIGAAAWLVMHRAPQAKPASVPVATAPLPAEMTFTGRVAPRTVVAVTAPIEGTLEGFFVDVGAEVIAGQLLGRVRDSRGDSDAQQAQNDLDRTRARLTALGTDQMSAKLEVSRADADLSRARGELERLRKEYERQKGLWAAGATARLVYEKSERDYNDAQATIERLDAVARAAAARAESVNQEVEAANRLVAEKTAAIGQVKDASAAGELHSPADGIVVMRTGQPGDKVDPSMKLMEIATGLTELQTSFTPDAVSLGRIRAGQTVAVVMGDQEAAGTVQEVRGSEVVVHFTTAQAVHKLDDPVRVRIKF